jgi:hypothetical protein
MTGSLSRPADAASVVRYAITIRCLLHDSGPSLCGPEAWNAAIEDASRSPRLYRHVIEINKQQQLRTMG